MKLTDYYGDTSARTADWDSSRPETVADGGGLAWMVSSVRSLPSCSGALLDIGCQSGSFLKEMAPQFIRCCGVDIGDYTNYWKEIENVEFQMHDIDTGPLAFADGSFDIVTCFSVLEHVFDVFGLVEEISRLTKPNGYAVIDVPNAGYIKHILSLIRGRVPRTGAQDFPFLKSNGWDGQHLHYFTLKELGLTFRSCGLDLIAHASRGKCACVRRLWPSLLYGSLTLTLQKRA